MELLTTSRQILRALAREARAQWITPDSLLHRSGELKMTKGELAHQVSKLINQGYVVKRDQHGRVEYRISREGLTAIAGLIGTAGAQVPEAAREVLTPEQHRVREKNAERERAVSLIAAFSRHQRRLTRAQEALEGDLRRIEAVYRERLDGAGVKILAYQCHGCGTSITEEQVEDHKKRHGLVTQITS